jgi:hypothetical protein
MGHSALDPLRPTASSTSNEAPGVAMTFENLVLELVPISAHLTAPRGTEARPKPRFSPGTDAAVALTGVHRSAPDSSLVLEGLEDVQPGRSPRGQNRGEDARRDRDERERDERGDR